MQEHKRSNRQRKALTALEVTALFPEIANFSNDPQQRSCTFRVTDVNRTLSLTNVGAPPTARCSDATKKKVQSVERKVAV
mmetsp:Transcript_28353/g.55511  ORF Transcript_28353/g.55511 Transcript_28353/m.55511 type:complete len:80 (+) Transcript_28353:293-532(+)